MQSPQKGLAPKKRYMLLLIFLLFLHTQMADFPSSCILMYLVLLLSNPRRLQKKAVCRGIVLLKHIRKCLRTTARSKHAATAVHKMSLIFCFTIVNHWLGLTRRLSRIISLSSWHRVNTVKLFCFFSSGMN
jgi:hypothetical protein